MQCNRVNWQKYVAYGHRVVIKEKEQNYTRRKVFLRGVCGGWKRKGTRGHRGGRDWHRLAAIRGYAYFAACAACRLWVEGVTDTSFGFRCTTFRRRNWYAWYWEHTKARRYPSWNCVSFWNFNCCIFRLRIQLAFLRRSRKWFRAEGLFATYGC